MSVKIIVDLMIKIFLMIAFGYFLKKKQIITPELQKGMNNLLLKAILPVSILSSSGTQFSLSSSKGLLYEVIIAAGYYTISLLLMTVLSKILPLKKKAKKIFITMTVFANTAFIGFPLVTELFGQEKLIYAVIYNIFYQLTFFTYGISILSGDVKFQLKSVFTNTITVFSFLSIAIFVSPFRFPTAVSSTLTTVGGMTVPISMILIGCSLADIKIRYVMKDLYSYLVSVLRLVIFPLGLLVILKILKVPDGVAAVSVIMTALPSGSLNAIYAGQYDCEPEYATRTVVQTMVLMIFTIPLVVLMINHFLK